MTRKSANFKSAASADFAIRALWLSYPKRRSDYDPTGKQTRAKKYRARSASTAFK
jgi:hypothetical protein